VVFKKKYTNICASSPFITFTKEIVPEKYAHYIAKSIIDIYILFFPFIYNNTKIY